MKVPSSFLRGPQVQTPFIRSLLVRLATVAMPCLAECNKGSEPRQWRPSRGLTFRVQVSYRGGLPPRGARSTR